MRTRSRIAAVLVAGAAAFTVAGAAAREHEHEHEHEGRGRERSPLAGPIDPIYAKECGACHVPYPPGLLPSASWRRIMADLERHFGQDAELEPGVRSGLERWLVDRGAPEGPAGGTPLRITELGWFRREHREVPRGAAARPSIGSMANCAACHPRAAAWDFDEDRVRIPAR